jgi:hypothetical protein
MTKQILYFFILFSCCCCVREKSSFPDLENNKQTDLRISSNDEKLTDIFNWAIKNSKTYTGNDNDPVGPWYESALPERESFCIRDISHQCIGEEINGHSRQNLNMFTKFVQNISESKDWCTYWEINRYNLPAPVDYSSDKDFWYNLNANFDIIDACYRLYLWTGNKAYIEDPAFDRFFRLSLNEYIDRWQLQADKIMNRPPLMNMPVPPPEEIRFKHTRGLPSYDEGRVGFSVSGDLIAMIYSGFTKYAEIQKIKGEMEQYRMLQAKANEYKDLFNTAWWNEQTGNYYFFLAEGELIEKNYSHLFLPWYGIVDNSQRLASILEKASKTKTNVESKSYYPLIYYKHSFPEIAYNYMNELYADPRRDYPEVASGLIEGIVCGLAGINADAAENRISSCPQFTDTTHWVAIENIPTFAGLISVLHLSETKTSLLNKGQKDITWRTLFKGRHAIIQCNGIQFETMTQTDPLGNIYSYVDIPCPSGSHITSETINN